MDVEHRDTRVILDPMDILGTLHTPYTLCILAEVLVYLKFLSKATINTPHIFHINQSYAAAEPGAIRASLCRLFQITEKVDRYPYLPPK